MMVSVTSLGVQIIWQNAVWMETESILPGHNLFDTFKEFAESRFESVKEITGLELIRVDTSGMWTQFSWSKHEESHYQGREARTESIL